MLFRSVCFCIQVIHCLSSSLFASSRVDDVETGKGFEFFPRIVSSTRLLFFQASSHLLDPLFPYHTGYPVTCCISASLVLRCLSPRIPSHASCSLYNAMSPPITFDCSHVSSVCLVLLCARVCRLLLSHTCYHFWLDA